jgi:hypothetical protein
LIFGPEQLCIPTQKNREHCIPGLASVDAGQNKQDAGLALETTKFIPEQDSETFLASNHTYIKLPITIHA